MNIIDMIVQKVVWLYWIITNNFTLDLLLKFVIVYFFVIWAAFVVWIVKDITNRTTNLFLQVLSILLVIFLTPIFWLPIYLLIRPRSTIFEKYYEQEEFQDEELLIEEDIESSKCPQCHKGIHDDYRICPYCELKLVTNCSKCKKEVKTYWKACPYCESHDLGFEKNPIKVNIEKSDKDENVEISQNIEKS